METIKTIEDKLGYSFPDDYKSFLLHGDSSKYKHKLYTILLENGRKTDGQIDRFVTIESFWDDNKYRNYLEEFQSERQIPRNYLESEYLYIIARCDTQSICMSLAGAHKGKIYNADNGDFGITFLATSLLEFLQSLYDMNN
jgi:hypothetical protein